VEPIKEFVTEKKQIFSLCPKVENVEWLGNMAFLVDVLQH